MKRNPLRRIGALLLGALLFFAPLTPSALATETDEDPAAETAALEDPQIAATAAILVNPDTGMVLYEKDADEKRYPASTTKVMTALLVLEHANLTDTVTAEDGDFHDVTWDASNADIKVGEQVRVLDLLYALMLPSANEAANMLARHVGGSIEGFVDMMNARAGELGCVSTHFVNPNGLHNAEHYTTARDLVLIAQAAMQDETFADVVSTAQHRMAKTNMHDERIILTTNQLIFSSFQPWYYAWCKGIKTGRTSEAGNCLISYAEKGKGKLFSVVLGAAEPDDGTVAKSFTETRRLFEWGFENFVSKTLAKKGDPILDVPVRLSTDTDHLVLTTARDLVASVPKNLDVDEAMEHTETVPDDVVAPIKAGDVIGSRTYSYDGVVYGTVELVALHDVSLSKVRYYADKLENFFQTPVFKVILVVGAVFLLLYLLIAFSLGRVHRRRQRKMMRSRGSRYNRRRRR